LFKQNQKNRNMKKLFLVLAIATAFVACNSEESTSTTDTTPATTEAAPATTEVAPATTEAPATTDAAPSSTSK
jgi:hypothetical protein